MDKETRHDEEMIQAFDQEIKELMSVMAELCVHEYLNQTQKETEDVTE